MTEIGDALATLSAGLKTLAEGINVISKQVNELSVDQTTAAKTTPQRTAKKAPSKAQASKKASNRKGSQKTGNNRNPRTASDTVFDLVKSSNNGVDYAHIEENTGYNKKKIANIFFNLKKQGKIRSVSKGVYTLA